MSEASKECVVGKYFIAEAILLLKMINQLSLKFADYFIRLFIQPST
jgi:hypothetical protein